MRRGDDGVGTFCARPPQGLAARSIERLRHFVFTLAREGIEAVAYEDRCRVIAIDRDLRFSQEATGWDRVPRRYVHGRFAS